MSSPRPNISPADCKQACSDSEYITKASSMREDLVEKNERSATVERHHLIDHLKEQEKSYMKFLQKIFVSFEPFYITY